jgi:CDP-ribitol ribitolphosphotransferase / teichoic acid ribitol-phosphate polymerase
MPTSTSSPGGVPPRAPAIDLVSITWRRIQVLLRCRAAGTTVDPRQLRLHRDGGSGPDAAPAGWERDGDDIVLRFNVMQGPGQVPLEPGRWRLVAVPAASSGRAAVTVAGARPIDPPVATAVFAIGSTEFVATPRIDPGSGALTLDVQLRPGTDLRPSAEASPMRRRTRPVVVRLGRAKGGLFRVMLQAFRALVHRTGRRILFSSDSRAELGGNLKMVYDRMVERGIDRDYELLTLFKESVSTRRSLRDRFRLPWLLARVDAIVIDDFQPIIYRVHDPDVRIVQLWHAVGAFKTVGYSRVGKPGGPSPYGRAHKNYTFATVSSTADVPIYAEAFGIPESHVIPTGVPRVDRFFDPAHRAAALAAALEAFPAAKGRFTILFAPTFRGHGARSATYDFGRIDYAALHALCVEKDAVCIIRMHPFVRDPLRIPDELTDRLLDGSTAPIDVNDLLFAVSLLITDYSSIVYEYSTLGRPVLFYAYDLEEYVASRDFYEPYETFVPGRIVRTFDELLDAIRRDEYEIDKIAPFAARHFDHLDGGSTDRVIDLILSR